MSAATPMQSKYHQRFFSAEERFWQKVDKNGPIPQYAPELGPCWLWTASTNTGYGLFFLSGRTKLAHIYSYELEHGPIQRVPGPRLEIDHLCRVRGCVRPTHLELVTGRENQLRGIGFAAVLAKVTHCKKGHEFTPENTRRRKDRPNERVCRVCYRALQNQNKRRMRARRKQAS